MTEQTPNNPTPDTEVTPEVAPESERPIEEQVDALFRESFDRIEALEAEGVPILRVGPGRAPVLPYENLDQTGISKKEYYNIIAHWLDQANTPYFRVGQNGYPFVLYENLGKQPFDEAAYYEYLAGLYQAEGLQFVKLGENNVPIPKYTDIEQGAMTAEEYFEQVSALISSPEDVAELLSDPPMVWREIALENGVEFLYPAEDVLAKSTGDCDNISWVGKQLFDRLEEKTGESYDARVVGLFNVRTKFGHAFLIYTDIENGLCAIDQGEHKTGLKRIKVGTNLLQYPELIDPVNTRVLQVERLPEGSNAATQHSLRLEMDEDLGHQVAQKDFKFLVLNIYEDYPENFSPNAENYPADWDLYETTHFRFMDGTQVVYKKTEVDGKSIMALSETHHGIDDPMDVTFYRTNGFVDQIHFRDDVKLFYSETAPTIEQISFPEGFAIFKPAGTLRQISFNEGPVEFQLYHPDGSTVKQRNFRTEEESPYKVIQFREDGTIKQYTSWEDESVTIQNPEEFTDEMFTQEFSPLEISIQELVQR